MEVLDLGGGFPAGSLSEHQVETLSKTQNQPFKVIAEPGRHFSSEACSLLMRVIGKRNKNN